MGISYPKDIRAMAASQGKDLFACGYAEAKGKGLSEFMGPMDWRMADAVFSFAHLVKSGKSPAEAFAAINWPAHPPKENRTENAESPPTKGPREKEEKR